MVLFGGACGFIRGGGCKWFNSGGGMHGFIQEAWFYLGGMRGFIWGACVVLFGGGGTCMVLFRGVCFFWGGGVRGFFSFFGYNEIRSMSGRYASYWNAFLYY